MKACLQGILVAAMLSCALPAGVVSAACARQQSSAPCGCAGQQPHAPACDTQCQLEAAAPAQADIANQNDDQLRAKKNKANQAAPFQSPGAYPQAGAIISQTPVFEASPPRLYLQFHQFRT